MKKSLFSSFLLVIIVFVLGYNIYQAKEQRLNLLSIQKVFSNLIVLNKELDLYLKSILSYDNFDRINRVISDFNENIDIIKNNEISSLIKQKSYINSSVEFFNAASLKIEKIKKVKSYRAILNNSYRIFYKLKYDINSNKYNKLYLNIMTLDKNPSINIKELQNMISGLNYSNDKEKFFLHHANKILEIYVKLKKADQSVDRLKVHYKLDLFSKEYEKFVNHTFDKASLSIGIIFFLLVALIGFYLFHEYKIIRANKNLDRFRKTVENSDNIVVITDNREKIKYVNEAFTKTTGYTMEEVKGKKPSILKSGLKSKEFYDDLNKTIYGGKKWKGEFINIDKKGNLSYEKASITPVFDDNGNIDEFIAIKLDITNETLKSQQLKAKENLLAEQSKMAAMGEMIGNIAHQWRQPLSVISTAATGMKFKKEMDVLCDEEFYELCMKINDNAQYLSQTIDDFRNFIKGKRNKSEFYLDNTIEKFLHLVEGTIKNNNITIVKNIDKQIKVYSYENELIQCFLNIFNNAKDAFGKSDSGNRYIFLDIFKEKGDVVISFKDSAGGIPDNVLPRIFEPYFTTKHESIGTGLGLSMTYQVIVEGMDGTIEAKNCSYNYKGEELKGAQFAITLPHSCIR